MAEVIFSPEAAAQLECLEEYLASRFYPGNAARYVERMRRPYLYGRFPQ
jgi:plasmid stabilization system protein ParE